jgi:nucleotide-binding universal stress UspA family protein
MPLSHILVPVDFSEKSECAARYAEALQRRFGSRITLLHVLPPPHYEFGAMEVGGSVLEELFRSRAEQARKDLDAFLAEELPPGSADRIIAEGDPAAKIVKTAHELGVSLIVMPTHGYGTFRRFILGSVTAKVLHDADCPVWTGVHMEAARVEDVRLDQVAVGVDLRSESERTLMWARRFAQEVGAQMALIHVMPWMEGPGGEPVDPDWQRKMEEAARTEIQGLMKRLGWEAPVLIGSGDVPEAVCRLAKEWGADLLVIGRGSASGVLGRLRANAYSIIRQSASPVVSV